MNRSLHLSRLAAAVAVAGFVTASAAHATEKPKYTIKEVMKALHKGDESLGKKVGKGEGTKEDFKKMVDYYASLPLQTPSKGDAGEWKQRATKLLESAKALEAGKPNALADFKAAVNCKACHSAHKED